MAALVEAPLERIIIQRSGNADMALSALLAHSASASVSSARHLEGFAIDTTRVLGEGSYSSVYEAVECATGQIVAAKLTDLSIKTHSRCHKNEVQSFKHVGPHKNLVKFYGDFVDNDVGVVILEKLTSLTLEDYISQYGRLSSSEAFEIFDQLISVVAFMHDKYLSPRDLKTENVAYDPVTRQVKLFDLGLSTVVLPRFDGRIPHVNVSTGSPLYMAPEVIACKPHNSFAHDIWCLGQILFTLLVGRSPFQWCSTLPELRDELLVFKKIKYPSSLDFKTVQFLRGLLEFDPKLRLDIHGVQEAFAELLESQKPTPGRNL